MTDLVSLSDIQSQLQAQAETRLLLSDAYRLAQQVVATYEADRAARAQEVADLNTNIVVLGNTIVADDAEITGLKSSIDVLDDKVTSLQGQVVTLTQRCATLDSSLSTANTALYTTGAQLAALTPDVTVTVGASGVVSRTVPAVSYVEQKPVWTLPAWSAMKPNLAQAAGAHKVHIYPFGTLDPQPDPTKPIDLVASGLANAFAKLKDISATAPIILTLYGATWRMKQTLYNGVITDLTSAQAYDDAGRVKYSQLPNWLALVDAAVALAAGNGIRDFECWNELKGYYDVYPHKGQTWDASMNPGNTATNPVMGYSYFYQQTANQVIATMARLGYARTSYRIGAPYMLMNSQGVADADSVSSTHPLYQYRTQWGYLDKEGDNALKQFLSNVQTYSLPLDTLLIDATTWNTDEQYPTADPFDLTRKYGDLIAYIRSLLPTYGLPADMPIDFSELYALPQPPLRTTGSADMIASMTADILAKCLLNRVRYPILWGPTAAGVGGTGGSNAGIVASDGTLQRVGQVTKLFKDNLAPGVTVYPLQSSDKGVDGLAWGNGAILFNKTAQPRKVAFGGDVYQLAPYAVRAVSLN
jgi:hypothetical protein